MDYLYVNLFNERDRGRLNPDEAIVRLQQQFPEAIILPGDQLALSARRAEQNLDQANSAQRAVAQKLRWDAQHLGPAYAFYIPAGPGPRIKYWIVGSERFQHDPNSNKLRRTRPPHVRQRWDVGSRRRPLALCKNGLQWIRCR
jgi:hypothetical protein